MKTFFTASTLAILSAVVFAWYLVQTGEELPRRSPAYYPPLGAQDTPPSAGDSEERLDEDSPKVVEEAPLVPEAVELVKVERAEVVIADPPVETPSPKDSDEINSFESDPMGPPAPVLPFVLNINAAEDTVSLQGSIPTREMKEAILSSITTVFGESEFESRLKFSPETRSGLWIGFLPEFIQRYFQYSGGAQELTVVDGKLFLGGSVPNEESKEVFMKWAQPLADDGLEIEDRLEVNTSLAGSVTPIPEDLRKMIPSRFSPYGTGLKGEDDESEALTETKGESAQYVEAVAKDELVFYAPFNEQYGVHTVPDLRQDESSETTSAAVAPPLEAVPENPPVLVDDGKPLIFEFESPTGKIRSEDQPKIEFAIARAQRPRSIVYITGYSDYRGSFEENQALALKRAEKVKALIFAEEIADEVTAEVKTRGDTLSKKRPGKETQEQLSRAQRVVVEVYHLR